MVATRKPAAKPPAAKRRPTRIGTQRERTPTWDETVLARAAMKRKPTNLSVRRDLIARAKGLRINISRVLEAALAVAIRQREQQQWLAENEESIDAYNAATAEHGLFSDDWRRF